MEILMANPCFMPLKEVFKRFNKLTMYFIDLQNERKKEGQRKLALQNHCQSHTNCNFLVKYNDLGSFKHDCCCNTVLSH